MFSPFSFSMESSTHRLVAFAKELVEHGDEVCIIMPSSDKHSNFNVRKVNYSRGIEIIQPYHPKTHLLELSTLPYIISSLLKTLPLDFDIIHVLKPLPINWGSYALTPLRRIPMVQDMDDLDSNVMRAQNQSSFRIKIVEQSEIFLPKFSGHITTCSSVLKRFFIDRGFKDEQVTWLPNGVETELFATKPNSSLKNKLNLNDKVLVYLGRMDNKYQVYPLIRAMELIVKQRTDVSCLIIGDGDAKPFFQQTVKARAISDYFNFVGRIPFGNVPEYLSICDIGFACCPPPLISTGGALKVFMYMAACIPVVVNPVGDLPYYIDGGNAGVVTQLDPKNLSNAFLELLENEPLRRKKGQHAANYVRTNFDWSVLVKRLQKVYRGISG